MVENEKIFFKFRKEKQFVCDCKKFTENSCSAAKQRKYFDMLQCYKFDLYHIALPPPTKKTD